VAWPYARRMKVRAVLMLSWLSLGRADEIVGAGPGQGAVNVQGGTWALGTFLGGILGVAGSLAKQTGDLIHSTASVVGGGGEAIARAFDRGGELVNVDRHLLERAGRGLICALVCPIRVGVENYICQAEHCQDENEIGRSEMGFEKKGLEFESEKRVGITPVKEEAEGLLHLGSSLLGMGTRLLVDIAFLKLRLLQGLFSRPDCWSSWRNNDNSCISQLCNTTEPVVRRQTQLPGVCDENVLGYDRVLVDTIYGPVVGKMDSELDPRFQQRVEWTSFTGIPYALPPVGQNRFRPPHPPLPWQCPLDATHKRNRICPQITFGMENDGLLDGSNEDCLYLNVYVPANRSRNEVFPVAVWLHGGAFMFGSGSACWFGPQFWMIHNIVLVTLNYRLGPLGFLSLGNEEIPGNAGMLDQVAALQWVQANIHRFGGDPGKVTLMGQSAGSFSTTYHLVSPKSRGLFHRIIAQSGVGGFSPSYHHYSERQAVKFGTKAAELVGCKDERSRVSCLQHLRVADVMTMDVRNELLSQPVVDGAFTRDPFLPSDPKVLMRAGKYNDDVEILLGFNEEEGHMVTSIFEAFPLLYSAMAAGWPILGPFTLLNKHHTEILPIDNTMANTILMEYVGNVSAIKAENLQQITNMFTDSFFSYGISKFLDYYLPKAKTKTYQYIFSYKEHSRASHSSELPLLWGVFKGKQQIASKGEKRMSKLLTTMWSNFMKYGNPTPRPIDKIKWMPSSDVKREYLVIGKETKMASSVSLLRRLSIWKAVLGED